MARNTLANALQEDHQNEMVKRAELIRDWPDEDERREHAIIHVRTALREVGLLISQETQFKVYSILSFVMPNDACYENESVPAEIIDQDAAWEMEHQKQVEKRSCLECGDGVCPTE